MKKRHFFALFFFLFCFIFYSCQTASKETDTKTFKIGVLLPESGANSVYSDSIIKGLECFVQTNEMYFNNSDSKIEIIYYDNKSDSKENVKGCSYLVNKREVDFILGPLTSRFTKAVIPVCDAAGVPIMTLMASEDGLTAQSPFAFRIRYSNSHNGYLLSKFSIENLHSKKAAVIYDSRNYHRVESSEGFKKGYSELGSGEVELFDITSGQSAVIQSLAEYQPDVIYLNFEEAVTKSTQIVNFIQAVERSDIETIFIGNEDFSSVDPDTLYSKINSEIYFINHHSPDSYERLSKLFSSDFYEIYGTSPDAAASLGYEALSVVIQLFTEKPGLQRKQILPTLQEGNFNGLLGEIRFNEDGEAFKSAVITKLSFKGKEYITTIKPEVFSVEEFEKEVALETINSNLEKQRLSVLELNGLNVDAIETQIVTELIGSSAVKLNRYIVIEAGQRDKIINEWKFALSGLNDEEAPFEIGKLISARKVISGSIAQSSNRVILNLKFLDVETGETLYASFKLYNSFGELLDNCEFLTYELLSKDI